MNLPDRQTLVLLGGVIAALAACTLIGLTLSLRVRDETHRETIRNLNARIRSWWIMVVVFALALATGGTGSLVLFGILSFLALREFITLTPTRPADHRALFWVFFVIAPVQYVLLHVAWYGLFSIFIPVYAFLFIPTRIAIAGDAERFLERTAVIQWGMMVCVYCVSHAPAILILRIPGYEGGNARLLLYLVIVVQVSDVLQYVFGKLLGRRKIAPHISPGKTWEGLAGGIACATAIGTLLAWATPFSYGQAAAMSLVTTLMGFVGGLTMSAIKRDRGVKDYGALIGGHGGVMDRIDSICFAAPVFFHLTRYFFT